MLLIEDDAFVAEVLERILCRLGKRVQRARNGAEGTQMLAAHQPEICLVMLDCFLPDVSGTALCRVFRRHSPDLPIVIMSGFEHLDTESLLEKGPTAFLPKPFYPRQVEEVLKTFEATA